jgi:hypothetical protein
MKNRLRWASDQCPLPGSPIRSVRHTRWFLEAQKKRDLAPDGRTQVLIRNKLLTWYRSFTPTKPKPPASSSLIVISEWLPEHEPLQARPWQRFGPANTYAYAPLHADYLSEWRTHAKRHLKTFQKTACRLRLGTRTEVANLMAASQVPKGLQPMLMALLDRHLAAHPGTIDILIAEKNGQPIACLVAGNCKDIKMSEYLIGAFHPGSKKDSAMVGLVDWWYRRSIETGCTMLSFGHMEPPHALPIFSGNGYSFFKTHFGIRRLWFPGSYWRVCLKGLHYPS